MPEGDFWDSEWRAIFRHASVRKSSGGAILNLLTFRHVVKLAISSARIGPEPFYGLYDWLRMPPLQNLMVRRNFYHEQNSAPDTTGAILNEQTRHLVTSKPQKKGKKDTGMPRNAFN